MPLSRAPRTPDLERVVQVLGGRIAREGGATEPTGWVPARPGSGPAPSLREQVNPDEAAEAVESLDDRLEADLRRARRAGLVTVPASIRAGRFSVSSSAVVGVLALVVALGCAFVLRILWAERSAVAREADPPVASTALVRSPTSLTGGTDSASAGKRALGLGAPGQSTPGQSTTAGAQSLVVHVVGQVAKPGLVRLPAGARVADAIAAAGGQTSKADVAALNLARPVVDGEQIVVPKPGDPVANPSAGQAGSSAGAGTVGGGGGLVNLNTADLGALDSLPGVGPVLAQRILDWRTEHGRFSSVDELGEVSGIGDKMLSQLRPKVTV